MSESNQQPGPKKRSRSVSLLTFLLLSGIVALSIAIYSANKEVQETRVKMAQQTEEMGYIEDVDESKLMIRRLGGYPQMSFAFRYQLPRDKQFTLHIGSGVSDPETDLPEKLLFKKQLSEEELQGILIVSLVEMPTFDGTRCVLEVIDGSSFSRIPCAPREFDWLQTYLAAFPTDNAVGPASGFFANRPKIVLGHEKIRTLDSDKPAELYSKSEFHPSAIDSLTPELLKNRKMFKIWLEPIEVLKPGKFKRGSYQQAIKLYDEYQSRITRIDSNLLFDPGQLKQECKPCRN